MLLEKILEAKKEELEKKGEVSGGEYGKKFLYEPVSLKETLDRKEFSAIAEIKRASPSAGAIRENMDIGKTAIDYQKAGASGISVLTCRPFFKGGVEDLKEARKSVDIPLLMKDFVFDRRQVLEGRACGADAVLLIMRILDDGAFLNLVECAESLELETLVEVHNEEEMERAFSLVACWDRKILGINNRNLETLGIDLSTTEDLMKILSGYKITVISESGIRCRDDVLRLRQSGIKGILVGEGLLKEGNPGENLEKLLRE